MNAIGVLARLKIDVKLTLAVALGFIGIIWILLFWCFPAYQELLKYSSLVVGGLAGIYSAFYVGKNIHLTVERDALHRSFEISNLFNTLEFSKVRKFLREEIINKSISEKELLERIIRNVELENAVRDVLNNLENISSAIQHGYADEKVLYKNLCVAIPFYFRSLYPYIKHIRNDISSEIYIEVEKLTIEWESGRYLFLKNRM